MTSSTKTNRLHDFAEEFVRDISHHGEVRSEALAEALRVRFGVPPFPTIFDLRDLCLALDVPLWRLPEGIVGVEATNVSFDGDASIMLDGNLRGPRLESSLAHEIRETIENAFQRVKPAYEGLPTHDNALMNPVSDRFAGYLLMQTAASRALMAELGFDVVEFARQTGRSLPSVVKRASQLFSSKSGVDAPVMGVWLFESPWELVQQGVAQIEDLRVRDVAKLGGFSQRRGMMTSEVFPTVGNRGSESPLVTAAVAVGRPHSVFVGRMALFELRDFLVTVEPISRWGSPWRAVMTAVRANDAHEVSRLLARLNPVHAEEMRRL